MNPAHTTLVCPICGVVDEPLHGVCSAVGREYVAVDALLSDAAVEAAWGNHNADGATDAECIEDMRAAVRAAVDAAKGDADGPR